MATVALVADHRHHALDRFDLTRLIVEHCYPHGIPLKILASWSTPPPIWAPVARGVRMYRKRALEGKGVRVRERADGLLLSSSCKLGPNSNAAPRRNPMLIGVPAETVPGETRVAVTSETAKKLVAQGHTVRVQSGAGITAAITDAAFQAAGAEITVAAGAPSPASSCSRCARPPTARPRS